MSVSPCRSRPQDTDGIHRTRSSHGYQLVTSTTNGTCWQDPFWYHAYRLVLDFENAAAGVDLDSRVCRDSTIMDLGCSDHSLEHSRPITECPVQSGYQLKITPQRRHHVQPPVTNAPSHALCTRLRVDRVRCISCGSFPWSRRTPVQFRSKVARRS